MARGLVRRKKSKLKYCFVFSGNFFFHPSFLSLFTLFLISLFSQTSLKRKGKKKHRKPVYHDPGVRRKWDTGKKLSSRFDFDLELSFHCDSLIFCLCFFSYFLFRITKIWGSVWIQTKKALPREQVNETIGSLPSFNLDFSQ